MCKLVHTHKIQKQLNTYIIHTIQVSPQCQACSKSGKRYHNSFNPQEKKNRHKIKYFCLFENFQCFWIFFFLKKQPKNKTTKNINKTCP